MFLSCTGLKKKPLPAPSRLRGDPSTIRRHSNIFIVHNLGEAQGMLRDNVVAAVPCSFGVKCHLHLKPTLIEKTGGSWLTQPEYGGTGSATVTMPR